ncbi:MAG: hypothetical protein WCI05_13750 [Myxococcales bacterium]|jgi:hypothetical protein
MSFFQGRSVVSPVLLALSLTLVGCGAGGAASVPAVAAVEAGEMPAGQQWTGVYYHRVYGYLHIIERDGAIFARWKHSDGSKWGQLSGERKGNLFRFEWKEYTYGSVGAGAARKGRGYFIYEMGPDGIAVLKGEYGLDSDETGAAWVCLKQPGRKSDPDSIKGEVGGADVPLIQDRWDQPRK